MHFEILIEDQSGKEALKTLVPQIIGNEHTYRIFPYKGLGAIPKGLQGSIDPAKRILLDRLPKVLSGYGKSLTNDQAVIVVCDLDDRCLKAFREELYGVLEMCDPKPKTCFCIAIEEGEAWYLGDITAIRRAYPHARMATLHAYENDSICGTWEWLADAVYPGGSEKLKSLGWRHIGKEKSTWAEKITPHMNVEMNDSPSFCYFRQKLRLMASSD